MNREINFRGKSIADIDRGEWVYGYLYRVEGEVAYIWNGVPHEVAADTVGQYSGLKDRNGKGIYESDLLKSGDIIFEVWWSKDEACYMLDMVNPFKEMSTCMSACHIAGMEVIGNRWDNPELLEDGK